MSIRKHRLNHSIQDVTLNMVIDDHGSVGIELDLKCLGWRWSSSSLMRTISGFRSIEIPHQV